MVATVTTPEALAENGITIDGTGNITITPPAAKSVTISAGAGGNVILLGLPEEDPEVEGALWLDTGVLSVSAGA